MKTADSIHDLQVELARYGDAGLRVALVPTMGALHEAHLQLIDEARRHADRVVASVFVNPSQFGPGEDFDAYPRNLEADARLLASRGTDLVFAPAVEEVYPDGAALATRVEVPQLGGILCGRSRPGHFAGVATVVAKLFNLVRPHVAVFGEKDYQQLMVIRRMARDLNFRVEILGLPTVREHDGLAMSSRNAYLTPAERATAPALYRQLRQLAAEASAGADLTQLEAAAAAALQARGFRPDYVQVLGARDLAPPAPTERELVVLAAAWLGRARLIDNLRFQRHTVDPSA